MQGTNAYIIFIHLVCLVFILYTLYICEKKYLLYSVASNIISLLALIYLTYSNLKAVDTFFLLLLVSNTFFMCMSISFIIYKRLLNVILYIFIAFMTILISIFSFFTSELFYILLLRSSLCLFVYFGLSAYILSTVRKNKRRSLLIVGYGLCFVSAIDITNTLFLLISKTNVLSTFSIDLESITIPVILILYEYMSYHERTLNIQNKLTSIRQNNKSRQEYMVNISHELRTPINVIINTLVLLEFMMKNGSVKIEKIKEYSTILRKNLNRLIKLINNFKSSDEIEKGELCCKYEMCEVVSFVREVVMSTKTYGDSKSLSIEFESDLRELYIYIDIEKIERVILNLISNAIKFTKKDGVIKVKVWEDEKSVMTSVVDNGIGIPEEKLTLIFDKFKQVDNELVRKSEGCGIGLFLAKAFVELHNGVMNVKSRVGEGSNFTFSIPKSFYPNEFKNCDDKLNFTSLQVEFSDI